MSMGCCQECGESPPCPEPVLEGVTASATGDPCGFPLPDHEDNTTEESCKRYAVKTSVYRFEYDWDGTTFVDFVEVDFHTDGETDQTYIQTKAVSAGACVTTYAGSDTLHDYSLTTLGDGRKWPETTIDAASSSSTEAACEGSATTVQTYESAPPDPGDTDTSVGDYFCYAAEMTPDDTWTKTGLVYTKITELGAPAGATGYQTETRTVTFSMEVLEPGTPLPSYPGWLSDSPPALTPGQGRLLSAENSRDCETITHRKLKYRVRHLPTGTCYLKVWISKVFTPSGGSPGAPTITTYEWSGTDNPCLTVRIDPVNADSQKINGGETDVPVPSSPGVTTVSILKYSCVPGYEPDISEEGNPQPNGFPDPTWEASPP